MTSKMPWRRWGERPGRNCEEWHVGQIQRTYNRKIGFSHGNFHGDQRWGSVLKRLDWRFGLHAFWASSQTGLWHREVASNQRLQPKHAPDPTLRHVSRRWRIAARSTEPRSAGRVGMEAPAGTGERPGVKFGRRPHHWGVTPCAHLCRSQKPPPPPGPLQTRRGMAPVLASKRGPDS